MQQEGAFIYCMGLTALSRVRRVCLKRGEQLLLHTCQHQQQHLWPGGRNGFYQDGVLDEEFVISLICNIQEVNGAAFHFNMTPLFNAIIQYGLPSKDLHTRASNISRSKLQSLQDVVKPQLIMQLSPFGAILQVVFFSTVTGQFPSLSAMLAEDRIMHYKSKQRKQHILIFPILPVDFEFLLLSAAAGSKPLPVSATKWICVDLRWGIIWMRGKGTWSDEESI